MVATFVVMEAIVYFCVNFNISRFNCYNFKNRTTDTFLGSEGVVSYMVWDFSLIHGSFSFLEAMNQ
jgi:hypothetical protein